MSEERPRRVLKRWQKRLKLMDWTITLVRCSSTDLNPDTNANVTWDADPATATIWLIRDEEITDEMADSDPDHFIEATIIHELLHIKFYGHGPVPEYDVNMERAINHTSEALMPRRRKRK